MLGKFILWLSAIIFTLYGLFCLISPELAASNAGLEFINGDAKPEIGSMYGGLQTGFGIYCLLGALKSTYYRPALTLLMLCIGALALARCFWAFNTDSALSAYTYGAIAYEYFTAILAGWALLRSNGDTSAAAGQTK
ncbi:MAG: DUF4345 family protein [Pseudomonadota bacterium]